MKRLITLILIVLLLAGQAFAATYYYRSSGTAANKGAASGPCTTLANCMNGSVYAGETFADGDIIVRCFQLADDGIDLMFLTVNQTLSIPSAANMRVDISANTRTLIGGNTRVTK